MLNVIGAALSILAGKSEGLSETLKQGGENLSKSPPEFQEICSDSDFQGCFDLPFMGSDLEERSFFSKFLRGYHSKHSCWFGYGASGLAFYVSRQRKVVLSRRDILSVQSNVLNGSLLIIKFRSPLPQAIKLKFGENSSAVKFGRYLSDSLKS